MSAPPTPPKPQNEGSVSRSGSLKLEMPRTEVDPYDPYLQTNYSDELNSLQTLNIDSTRFGAYGTTQEFSPYQYDPYSGYLSNHDSYVETDQSIRNPPDHWNENEYAVPDISEPNSESSVFQNDDYSNYGQVGQRDTHVRSKVVGNAAATVTPQSRHARRLYVGGLTPANCDEESIKTFFNTVICTALGDEPNSSYLLSIYVNPQKCFSFIELNSIELTTACLELDGILFQNNPLKILRANEYKPDLLPPPQFPPIKLNLSGLLFSSAVSHQSSSQGGSPTSTHIDPQIDQLIKYCSINTVQRGSIVIVGFPYDDLQRRGGVPIGGPGKPARGCALAPRIIRAALRKFQCGPIFNPEYNLDLAQLKIFDIGDIPGGLTSQDAIKTLVDVVSDVIQRGAYPLVLGGSSEVATNVATGLITVSPSPIGVINVGASCEGSVLDDSRFFVARPNYGTKLNCEGRFIQFAAQGTASLLDQTRLISERGGKIIWLGKDIRGRGQNSELISPLSMSSPPVSHREAYTPYKNDCSQMFKNVLSSLNPDNYSNSNPRPVCVSFSMSSMSSTYFPGHSQLRSTGLTSEEAMDIAINLGKDKNVSVISINDFNVDVEEHRSSRLVADFIYSLFVGFAMRLLPGVALRSVPLSLAQSRVTTPRTVSNTPRPSTPQSISNIHNPSLSSYGQSSGFIAAGYSNTFPDGFPQPNIQTNPPRANYTTGVNQLPYVPNLSYPNFHSMPQYNAGFDNFAPNSSRSRNDSPTSYQSGYTTSSIQSRSGTKNESPVPTNLSSTPPNHSYY